MDYFNLVFDFFVYRARRAVQMAFANLCYLKPLTYYVSTLSGYFFRYSPANVQDLPVTLSSRHCATYSFRYF